MTGRCVIDTNVLIEYLGSSASPALIDRVEQALTAGAMVSVVTTMELLGWRGHSEQSRRDAEALLAGIGEIGLPRAVVAETVRLRSVMAIKLPDAIIAASALIECLPLMTRNTDDFKSIPGLHLRMLDEG